jgi:hypothetical protein
MIHTFAAGCDVFVEKPLNDEERGKTHMTRKERGCSPAVDVSLGCVEAIGKQSLLRVAREW